MLVDSCRDNNTQDLRFEIQTPHFSIYTMYGPYLLGCRERKKTIRINKGSKMTMWFKW